MTENPEDSSRQAKSSDFPNVNIYGKGKGQTDDHIETFDNDYIAGLIKAHKEETGLYTDRVKYKKFLERMILGTDYDPDYEGDTLIAVTVNIKPTKYMNKKQWKKYEPVKQVAILDRIEKKSRKDNKRIELMEIHYEVCPKLSPKQMHFHAFYRIQGYEWISELTAYWDSVIDGNQGSINKWNHLVIKEVYDREGWENYIRKDIGKN